MTLAIQNLQLTQALLCGSRAVGFWVGKRL